MFRFKNTLNPIDHTKAFQQVRMGLNAANLTGKPGAAVVVGFMSREQGEGVSTTVSGLAGSLSEASPGTVLVIDANPQGRRIAEILGMGSHPLSRKHLQTDTLNLDDFLVNSGAGNLALLTLDFNAKDKLPFTLEFGRYLGELKTRYGTILVDLGSWDRLSPVNWVEHMNHLVLVIDSLRTTRESLVNFRNVFDRSGFSLSSFILTKQERPVPDFIYRTL